MSGPEALCPGCSYARIVEGAGYGITGAQLCDSGYRTNLVSGIKN